MAKTTFSGPVESLNGFIGAFSSTSVELQSNNANKITLDAPNSLVASYSFILPPNDGDNGQTLTTNGSGVTTWTTPFNPAAPGAIGGTTAAAGSFTTLSATDNASLTAEANVLVIPTSDPGVLNALWLDGETIKVSAGA
jgi:hypothetical protein